MQLLLRKSQSHIALYIHKGQQQILQILLHPIPRESDYIVVVALKAVDVFTESSLYSVSTGLVLRLGSLHIGEKFFIGIILEIY